VSSLQIIQEFDPWKSKLCTCPPKYSLQPYTGCSHRCLYCYATSYIRTRRTIPKKDAIGRLIKDLQKIDPKKHINMSTSSDPYTPEEKVYNLTRRILSIIVSRGFKVLITTKGTLVLRDIDIIRRGNVAVMMTITTLDPKLASIIEPNAPSPLDRLRTLCELSRNGVPIGARIDPIIPHVNDDEEELRELVDELIECGVRHIVTSTYKAKPDNLKRLIQSFPDIEEKLRHLYIESSQRIGGYRYLKKHMRKKLLMPVIEQSKKHGISVATCREGFENNVICDGSQLIPNRIPIRGRRNIRDFLRTSNHRV